MCTPAFSVTAENRIRMITNSAFVSLNHLFLQNEKHNSEGNLLKTGKLGNDAFFWHRTCL
jgi:hypothetical protein